MPKYGMEICVIVFQCLELQVIFFSGVLKFTMPKSYSSKICIWFYVIGKILSKNVSFQMTGNVLNKRKFEALSPNTFGAKNP